MRDRIGYIDSLRGWAVVGTFLVHNGQWFRSLHPLLAKIADHGSRGVQLFYIISAYTIFVSLSIKKSPDYRAFFKRRFFRIAPLFYTVLLLCFIANGDFLFKDWINLFAKLLFIDNFYAGWANHGIIGVEWSVGVEVIFYCITPMLFTYCRTLKSGLIALLLAVVLRKGFDAIHLPDQPVDWALWKTFSFIKHSQFFLLGLILFLLQPYWKKLNQVQRQILSDFAFFAFAGLLIALLVLPKGLVSMPVDWSLLFFFMFYAASGSRLAWLIDFSWMRYLGKISFSVYLLHLLVHSTLNKTFKVESWNGMATLASFGLTVLLSTATYYWIEEPLIRFSKKRKSEA